MIKYLALFFLGIALCSDCPKIWAEEEDEVMASESETVIPEEESEEPEESILTESDDISFNDESE